MIIKYTHNGDRIIANIPDGSFWEIRFRMFDNDTGNDDFNLYLIHEGREITLRDTAHFCRSRNLSCYCVGAMYGEMVDVIAARLANDPNLRILDIDAIESELLTSKYEKLFLEEESSHTDDSEYP